jgi:low affinity Fe/Cu permease
MGKLLQPFERHPGVWTLQMAFRRLAERASRFTGSPTAFIIALILILGWAISGFYLEFNETWQLFINTATTIGTFLMVILVQNTQNRDARSTQLKLDELLRGTKNTRNSLMEIEELSDEELDALKEEFHQLREKYIARVKKRRQKS